MIEELKRLREELDGQAAGIRKQIEEVDAKIAADEEAQKEELRKNREQLQKEALTKIEGKRQQAYDLIKECQHIADASGVGFNWDLAYGMGGWYKPKLNEDGEHVESGGQWQSSSSSC